MGSLQYNRLPMDHNPQPPQNPLKKLPERPQNSFLILLIAALVLTSLYFFYNPNTQTTSKIAVSQFIEDVKSDKVKRIEVQGSRVEFSFEEEGEYEFFTVKESGATMQELLEGVDPAIAEKIEIEISDSQNSNFWRDVLVSLIPFALLILFFLFMMRQAQGANNQAMSFGKSSARLAEDNKKKTKFKEVAGADEAKNELEEIVEFLKHPKKFTSMGAKIPKGVLLLGPPGCGKTLLARAVAGEANVPFFNISGSEFVEMFVGVGASVTGDTPVLVKDDQGTRLVPIKDVVDEYYPENKSDYPIAVQNVQTLGFNQEKSKFWGSRSKTKHFFGGSGWKNVQAVYRHKANRIYEIEYLGGILKTTGDHSIFIREKNMIKAKKASELKAGEVLVNLPFKVRSTFIPGFGTTHKVKAHSFERAPYPIRLTVQESPEREFAASAYANALITDGLTSAQTVATAYQISATTVLNWRQGKHLPQALSEEGKTPLPKSVEITPELCKLLGYYTAEGSANHRLEFTFGLHEASYHKEVIETLKTIFKVEPITEAREEDHSFRITVRSAPLGRFFGNHCGNGSKNKHIPAWLWEMPGEYFWAYLEGYSNGDGYTTQEGKLSCTSVSKQLIMELAWLASMHGLQERGASPYQFKKPRITKITVREYNDYVYDLCGCEGEAFFGGEKPLLLHNSRVRDLFKRAKKNAPCIVFIDEIDAVGRQRGAGLGGGHDEREQTLNQILTEMDGFEQGTNIILIAATNRADVLDPALLRPGRFDRRVVVDRPDVKAREEILKVHARNKPMVANIDLKSIARQTPGFSGADIENLMNESAILAAKQDKKKVDMADIEASIEKVALGPERKSRVMSPEEKKITAYHEVGHALSGHFSPLCDPVHKVSIVSRGMALGVTWFVPKEDKMMNGKSKFMDEITAALGGYVAEELIFGEMTTGASNDLQKATRLARQMVTEYGMSPLGPIIFGEANHEVFLGRDYGHVRNYSEKMAAEIDGEVEKFVKEGYKRSRGILEKHKELLHKIATSLLEKETLSQKEFLDFLPRSTWKEAEIKAAHEEEEKAKAHKKRAAAPHNS